MKVFKSCVATTKHVSEGHSVGKIDDAYALRIRRLLVSAHPGNTINVGGGTLVEKGAEELCLGRRYVGARI